MRTEGEYLVRLDTVYLNAAGGKSFPGRKDLTTPNVSKMSVEMGNWKFTQKSLPWVLCTGQTLLLNTLPYTY